MAKRKWKQTELELKPEEKPKVERKNYRQEFMDKYYKGKPCQSDSTSSS